MALIAITSHDVCHYVAELTGTSVAKCYTYDEAAHMITASVLRGVSTFGQALNFVDALHMTPDRDIVQRGLQLATGSILNLVGRHINCHRQVGASDAAFRTYCLAVRSTHLVRKAKGAAPAPAPAPKKQRFEWL